MSAREYRDMALRTAPGGRSPRSNKFGAVRVDDPDHGAFDSTSEHRRFLDLKALERAGAISNLRRQVRYPLAAGDHPLMLTNAASGSVRQAVYIADYVYDDHALGKTVIEDRKGVDTRLSQLKRAILSAMLGVGFHITTTGVKPRARQRAAKRPLA